MLDIKLAPYLLAVSREVCKTVLASIPYCTLKGRTLQAQLHLLAAQDTHLTSLCLMNHQLTPVGVSSPSSGPGSRQSGQAATKRGTGVSVMLTGLHQLPEHLDVSYHRLKRLPASLLGCMALKCLDARKNDGVGG